jgi:hypothetical protein
MVTSLIRPGPGQGRVIFNPAEPTPCGSDDDVLDGTAITADEINAHGAGITLPDIDCEVVHPMPKRPVAAAVQRLVLWCGPLVRFRTGRKYKLRILAVAVPGCVVGKTNNRARGAGAPENQSRTPATGPAMILHHAGDGTGHPVGSRREVNERRRSIATLSIQRRAHGRADGVGIVGLAVPHRAMIFDVDDARVLW